MKRCPGLSFIKARDSSDAEGYLNLSQAGSDGGRCQKMVAGVVKSHKTICQVLSADENKLVPFNVGLLRVKIPTDKRVCCYATALQNLQLQKERTSQSRLKYHRAKGESLDK